MSKPPKTPVPLPGSKTKTPVSASSTKRTPIPLPTSKSAKKNVAATQLSNELVGDSDDSSEEVTKTSNATQKKASTTIAVHRPKANGVAKEAKTKQKDTQKKATKEIVSPKKPAPAPRKVTTEEESASTSSSEDSSDDAETDIKQAQQREAQRKQRDDSESSSEDSSDESEEGSTPAARPADARPAQSQSQTVTFQQARPYVPPEDFKAASTERSASSANVNIFKNLDGKQIWHITAPEGVSLGQLTNLAMDKAQNGEAVLEHKGTSYSFSPAEIGTGEREVLIPVPNGYKAVPTKIAQSFHMHQVVNLPKLTSKQADQNTGSEAAASITASTIRAVKPQVKGLKMRFFPSGFEDSVPTTLGDSDNEDDAPAPAGLGIPQGFDPPARKEKKRKHEQSNAEGEADSSAKKPKKHRTAEEQQQRDEKKARKEKKGKKSKS